MPNSALKSVNLKGNLNINSSLKYGLTTFDFKRNLWLICLKDIAIENKANTNLSAFAYIQCNLVNDLRTKESRTEIFLPPIATVLLKASPQEKRIINLEKIWFQVNVPNDVLILKFVDPKTETTLQFNCDIFVTVLMKQFN